MTQVGARFTLQPSHLNLRQPTKLEMGRSRAAAVTTHAQVGSRSGGNDLAAGRTGGPCRGIRIAPRAMKLISRTPETPMVLLAALIYFLPWRTAENRCGGFCGAHAVYCGKDLIAEYARLATNADADRRT